MFVYNNLVVVKITVEDLLISLMNLVENNKHKEQRNNILTSSYNKFLYTQQQHSSNKE
jgi:hypothetical protein